MKRLTLAALVVGLLFASCTKRDFGVRKIMYNTKDVPFEIPVPDVGVGSYKYLNIKIFSDGYASVVWKQPQSGVMLIKYTTIYPDGKNKGFSSTYQSYDVLPSHDTIVVWKGTPYILNGGNN